MAIGVLVLRRFGQITGFIFWALMASLLSLESKLASRVKDEPQRSIPTRRVKSTRAVRVSGKMIVSCWLTGLIAIGPSTKPWFSTMVSSLSPCWCVWPEEPRPWPPFLPPCWSHHRGGLRYQADLCDAGASQTLQRGLDTSPLWTTDCAICTRSCRGVLAGWFSVGPIECLYGRHTRCN